MKLLKDIEKVTRQKIPAIDRRNDRVLQALDASIMASGVAKKATLPDREGENRGEGRGRNRNPRRDGVKPEGGGQPHRQRKTGQRDRTHHAERPAQTFDPMAGDRARSTGAAEAKPAGEMKRRRRRPSNGGKGYVAKA
jgi:ATP-dependent RNA helicase RhlE